MISGPSFFVEAAHSSRVARWRTLFELAWGSEGKGLTINLAEVPESILNMLLEWRNDKVRDENSRTKQ